VSTEDERAAGRREAQERRERRQREQAPALQRAVLMDLVLAAHHLISDLSEDLHSNSQMYQRSEAWDSRARVALTSDAVPRGTITFGELAYQVQHLELTGGALRVHGLAGPGAAGAHRGRGELRDPDGQLVWAGAHVQDAGVKTAAYSGEWALQFDAAGSPAVPAELCQQAAADIEAMGNDAPLSLKRLRGYLTAGRDGS
jgi:hypothetical protein